MKTETSLPWIWIDPQGRLFFFPKLSKRLDSRSLLTSIFRGIKASWSRLISKKRVEETFLYLTCIRKTLIKQEIQHFWRLLLIMRALKLTWEGGRGRKVIRTWIFNRSIDRNLKVDLIILREIFLTLKEMILHHRNSGRRSYWKKLILWIGLMLI